MSRSDLPFGSEFTPARMSLVRLLELADEFGGDRPALQAAIRREYFGGHDTSDVNKDKLAGNTCISMGTYGLLDAGRLTPLGRGLLALKGDEAALYGRLARHILLHLNGMNLIHCLEDMQVAGEEVTLETLRPALASRGVHFPSGGKHPSVMRLWLERAGVFASGWRVDAAGLAAALGGAADAVEALARLNDEQRSFLRALANAGGGTQPSNEVQRLAAFSHGTAFSEKSLPATVLYPLRDAGFVTLERGTKQPGRGARPFLVTPTEKLARDVLEPLFEQFAGQIDATLRALLRRPLPEVMAALKDPEPHARGLALEALAFKLMRLIDLRYVRTRLRGAATGGAEVDVVFESSRLAFARWQIQCKNTARVALDDVAKEVGLTHVLKSSVVVMVSTGAIGHEARRYADQVMRDSNLAIAMIDRDDLEAVARSPAAVVAVLNREAAHAGRVKRLG